MNRHTTGRPPNTRKVRAARLFMEWRNQGEPFVITLDKAFALTGGLVGESGSDETINLSTTAMRFVLAGGK